MRMGFDHIRYSRRAFRGQVAERAKGEAELAQRVTDRLIHQTAQAVRLWTRQQVRHGAAAMRRRQRGQRRDAPRSGKSVEVASDQGAAVESAHRMRDDMARTLGESLLDQVA